MKKHKIINLIIIVILIIVLYFAYDFYQTNNFNKFTRSESNLYTSEFKRDNEIKYSNKRSYKISSPDYNDAVFSQKIKVEENTPYKITAMVKVKDVATKEDNSAIGAQLCITDTTERSIAISGTQDWQKIELIVNSKNRDVLDIGFRLGGYAGEANGQAWFSDFTIEAGVAEKNTEWNFACFIFESLDVVVDNKPINIKVSDSEISDIKNTLTRFKTSSYDLSQKKITTNCDIFNIKEPITKLSYDKEFGYLVSPEDIESQIKTTIENANYDHIFIIVKLGNEKYQNDIEVNDWIGLGSMDYYGIGYSIIRLPNEAESYIYKYDQRINQFPEEVFLHEFLHTLERNSTEYGYKIPELHDYEKYGYENEKLIGQKKWYSDYINKQINNENEKIGLPNEIFELKPAKKSNFTYSYKLNEFKGPENIIEEIREIFENLVNKVKLVFA